jgi:ATP-binding cassette, subfamily F, member 3
MQPEQARRYLAQYLFRGDDVFTPVGALSGGERARLALAILALEGSNFLLLDEPTNHLDIPAQEALQDVLENFPGTILLVSHDRYLIDRLATQVWEIHDHRLETFQGSYRDYVLSKSASLPVSQGQKMLLIPQPLLRGDSREARKKIEQIAMLEERIRQQEKIVHRLARELQKPGVPSDYEVLHEISWQMAKAQSKLDDLLSEWEALAV